jgi:sulfate transport system ATP-binding protein
VNVLPSSAQIFQSGGFDSANPEIFLRPHDVVVETKPNGATAPARVTRLIHLGWEIQAELTLGDGQVVMANLTRERFDQLKLEPDQQVFVKPRDAKAFPLYYEI